MTTTPKIRRLKRHRNLVQIPYRGVSYQPYAGKMTEAAIVGHLLGKEAYRRTHFVILHDAERRHALAAIEVADREILFSPIEHVEVLTLPEQCVFIKDPATDCANRSALAELAVENGIGPDRTLICEGKYDHINFIHRPDPVPIRVIEVAPPEPPKLMGLVRQVLAYADLPPIRPVLERIDLRDLCASVNPSHYLVPCRSGGLDDLGAPVHFLDERPEKRLDWVLVGCERSLQFHRHYYGDEPQRVEMCPRKLAKQAGGLTLLKCCLLEFDIEKDGDTVIVPWGADLAMVERALKKITSDIDTEGDPPVTSIPNSTAWHGFRAIDEGPRSRSRRRGQSGLTMVLDTGLGMSATNDILDLSGAHIDHWKLGFGTSAVMPERLLRQKLDLLRSYGILTYPGGTLLEAVLLHDSGGAFIARAKDLGFQAVEISEGTLPVGEKVRRSLIQEARNAGIVPVTEVGSKDPTRQFPWRRVVEQAREDLECGAAWVIMEGRESGANVGIYDGMGRIREDFLERLVDSLADCLDKVIWEAPCKSQQCQLIHRLGANVNLGNIEAEQCLALEALRRGLRFETLKPTVEASQPAPTLTTSAEPTILP
ncbi:phosphosulfolactate synthase [Methylohalobius crimeensis]|uniref:DUF7714 family protein n=1 Tax=Methylohalobius crimeensis TaxID=244365 RepID=UPI0003F75716|nr:phosphosulfolactate synthase [Methylohalobius crimeensis]